MVLRSLLFSLIGWVGLSMAYAFPPAPWSVCAADSGIKITVSGKVFDRRSEQPIAAKLSYQLLPAEGNETKPVRLDPATGEFSLELAAGAEYRFTVEAEGYQPMVKRVNLTKAGPEDQVTLTLNLNPIPKEPLVTPADPFGTLLTIVYFKSNGVELTPDSRTELDRLLTVLRANPNVRVSVHGHADVKGSFEQNMRLSELRAQAVRAYLIAHDIAPYRLPTISYSNAFMMTTFPKVRQLNNRVEFHLRAD
jgi:outer membrane protein OmpA-like peptidoglycan-associated protein